MGSRGAYRTAELGAAEVVELSPHEIEFIGARDSFYQGTVGENGWPYVQHRGGPTGFLKVLGPQTIGYADFSGNRQYISVGNLDGDERVSLFLMDYPEQRRLKIWGRARLINEDAEQALVARLESPGLSGTRRAWVIITVEAFD
jgi:predicted pyridoxine 5'-phosphate oxidase superfamily flavin-nucleotide-binding protein